jgi:hypothetical protein
MLAKAPGRRPQSADEVITMLDQALPYLDKIDVAPTGETTIQWGHNPLERTTEGMYVPPPVRGTFSTRVQRTTRVKPSAVYAMIIGAALVAVGYSLYHYVSGDAVSDGRRERSQTSVTTQPAPSTPVAEVQAPSPNPAAVVTPPPGTTPGPQDRREENPASTNRSRLEDRRLADKHFEKAQALVRQRRYRDALKECNEVLKLNPQHGKAQELKRQINDAIKILNPQ